MKTTRLRGFLSKDLCGLEVNLLASLPRKRSSVSLSLMASPLPRNSDANPDSPQVVVFLATIIDVIVDS